MTLMTFIKKPFLISLDFFIFFDLMRLTKFEFRLYWAHDFHKDQMSC